MSSYTKLTYHVVFSTKYRRRTITEPLQKRLYEYIGGIIRAKKGHLIEIGGVTDHIHILSSFSPTIAVSDMVRDLKANAAKWMNELGVSGERFEWQKGYGAFTVSASQIPNVRQYVQNQKEHHRVTTFEEEYVALLKRHGIEFDRRYLFEAEHYG
ncbi:MAG: IS200/IS605 family transposase [Planctomycetaceae bacterium]